VKFIRIEGEICNRSLSENMVLGIIIKPDISIRKMKKCVHGSYITLIFDPKHYLRDPIKKDERTCSTQGGIEIFIQN